MNKNQNDGKSAAKIGARGEVAQALRRSGVATEEERARIDLWASGLPYQRFLVEEEKLGDLAQTRILDNLERHGICLIRPVGLASTKELVDSIIQMIGTPTEWQNEDPGPIKDIRPKVDIDANTGNSKGDLGFHVDGTQHLSQPPVLLFQYATGATWEITAGLLMRQKSSAIFPSRLGRDYLQTWLGAIPRPSSKAKDTTSVRYFPSHPQMLSCAELGLMTSSR